MNTTIQNMMAYGESPRPINIPSTGVSKGTSIPYYGFQGPTLVRYSDPLVPIPTIFLLQLWNNTLLPNINNMSATIHHWCLMVNTMESIPYWFPNMMKRNIMNFQVSITGKDISSIKRPTMKTYQLRS